MDFRKKRDQQSPWTRANFFSKLFFWWILPLFSKSKERDLSIDDLATVLPENESEKLGNKLQSCWDEECKMAEKTKIEPKFYKALISVFWKKFLILGLTLAIAELVIRVGQTILVQLLIASFTIPGTPQNDSDQYLFALGVAMTTFAYSFCFSPCQFGLRHLGMKCRVATSSLIYRKALRLSRIGQGQTTVGQMTNLLSHDVNLFDSNLVFLHYVYIGPIQAGIFIYLLWTLAGLGLACLAGTGVILVLMLNQIQLKNWLARFTLETTMRSDNRAEMMRQIIAAIQVIKMYTWERLFSAKVHEARRLEVKAVKKSGYLGALHSALFLSSSRLSTYFMVLVAMVMGGRLRSHELFFVVAIVNLLWQNILVIFPAAVAHLCDLKGAIHRFESFLLLDEKAPTTLVKLSGRRGQARSGQCKDPIVILTNASTSQPTLKDISLSLTTDQIVMVVGPVGSGKTSLLQTLISELPTTVGQCWVKGGTSYASQRHWIFPGTIKENVLFGREFNSKRYTEVLQACALDEELKQLPFGENMQVTSRKNGAQLSETLKARINLARALYQKAEVYLLDDPLSAVDPKVGRHIFDNCVQEFLSRKLRILVTHQLQYLPQADHVVVFNEGKILAQGKFSEIVQGIDLVNMVATPSPKSNDNKLDRRVRKPHDIWTIPIVSSIVKDPLKRHGGSKKTKKSDIRIESRNDSAQGDDNEGSIREQGKVTTSSEIYWKYLTAANSLYGIFFLLLAFTLSQFLLSACDLLISYWTIQVEKETHCPHLNLSNFSKKAAWCQNHGYVDNNLFLYVYTGLIVGVLVVTLGRAMYSVHYCLNLSQTIHSQMVTNLFRAPIQFFEDNPSARVLNRFVKDIGAMDQSLPLAIVNVFSIFLYVLGLLVVIILSNFVLILPATALLIVLGFLRTFYIQAARQVKRIEVTARSPILTHLSTTVEGLATIRASKSEQIFRTQFDGYQNVHSTAWFIFLASNQCFFIWIEVVSAIFVMIVTLSFPLLADWISTDQVGLAVTSALALSFFLQFGLRQVTETEDQMTSVERAIQYTELDQELPLESMGNKKPPKIWPTHGSIKFRQVSMVHNEKYVLKNISFEIKPKEKIGIIGSTLAEKNSIISALFRIYEPQGDIFINGIRTRDLGLHDLRRKISIIPQDPIFIKGSIRYNLDPFDQMDDDQLWRVIQEVELIEAVPTLSLLVEDGGTNFSFDQRLLLSLARAMLRKNQILVIDETDHVDPRTNELVQRIVRTKFDCSVIMVAHRFESLMNCDKILVLENGAIKEFDEPLKLRSDPSEFLH